MFKKFQNFIIGLLFYLVSSTAFAGVPVIDLANLTQTTVSAMQNVAADLEQIQQYSTQLQQYKNELTNSLAPASQVWNDVQSASSGVQSELSTIQTLSTQMGNINTYLSQFQNAGQMTAGCVGTGTCTASQIAALQNTSNNANQTTVQSINAAYQNLQQQQIAMQQDAATISANQTNAQSSQGVLAALANLNMLASQENGQLLQIRSLLISQQNIEAAQALEQAQNLATQAASSAYLGQTASSMSPTTGGQAFSY